MNLEIRPETLDVPQRETIYLKRRVREEADAAANAPSLAAALIHVDLATAYAERCCKANDRAWIAENRAW